MYAKSQRLDPFSWEFWKTPKTTEECHKAIEQLKEQDTNIERTIREFPNSRILSNPDDEREYWEPQN